VGYQFVFLQGDLHKAAGEDEDAMSHKIVFATLLSKSVHMKHITLFFILPLTSLMRNLRFMANRGRITAASQF
jgi:hypothetical protein